MLTNKNLVNFVDANEKNYEIQGYIKNAHVSLAIAAFTFDASIMENFYPSQIDSCFSRRIRYCKSYTNFQFN